jgi:hypothetical protein
MNFLAKLLCLIVMTYSITSQARIVAPNSNESTTDVICSYAPSQNSSVNRIASAVGGAGVGAAAILEAAGISIVAHSAGGYILTGSGGYIAGTMTGVALAPALITASVLVGGTAVLVELSCAPKNHPTAVSAVKKYNAEFNKALSNANAKAVKVRDNTIESVRKANEQAIDVRDAANDKAIEFRDSAKRLFAKGTL